MTAPGIARRRFCRRAAPHRLGYTTARECIDLLTATYRTGQLLPRHRYIAEEVATRAHAQRDAPTSDPRNVAQSRISTAASVRL